MEEGTHARYSGLWECYDDPADREREVTTEMEPEGEEAMYGRRFRNIQGYLLKRRKAPLKGWHKAGSSFAYVLQLYMFHINIGFQLLVWFARDVILNVVHQVQYPCCSRPCLQLLVNLYLLTTDATPRGVLVSTLHVVVAVSS